MLRFRTAVKLTFALLAVWLGLVWAGLAPRPAFLPPNLDIEPLTYLLGALAAMLFIFWKNPVPANTENTSIPPQKEIIEELRANLRERYERRKKNKLAGGIEMFLRMVPTAIGTSPDIAKHHTPLPEDEITQPVEYFFDKSEGRLLVIGLPGTGKTYQLLELALSLLGPKNPEHEDFKKKKSNIPVLLNLATWRTEFETLDGWLRRILPLELGASRALAERILHSEHLILLLDGLDEVPEADRASCLKAIGMYGKDLTRRFAITSRRDEYVATAEDAFVKLEVEMQLLSPEKIQQNLAAWEAKNLSAGLFKDALQIDPLLREAISNPFYLNTAQLLFATGRKYSDLGFTAIDMAGRQRELVERFVEDALERKVGREYPKEKALKWLGFLAKCMDERKIIRFELRDLQYDWNESTWSKFNYKLAVLSKFTIIYLCIFACFFFASVRNAIENTIKGNLSLSDFTNIFILPIFITVSLGLYHSLFIKMGYYSRFPRIDTKEKFQWNFFKFSKRYLRFSAFNELFGWGILLAVITFFGVMFGENTSTFFGSIISALGVFSLVFFGGTTLMFAIVILFFLGNSYSQLFHITHPYQRFTSSLKNFDFSFFRHLMLRCQLSQKHLLPLRLVTFLNEMSLRHLLEFDGDPETGKGGGAWRWRHRIIQEYFLEKGTKK